MALSETLERASATGFCLPGRCRIVQLYSATADIWRRCRADHESDALMKAWTMGWWSVHIVNGRPSKR